MATSNALGAMRDLADWTPRQVPIKAIAAIHFAQLMAHGGFRSGESDYAWLELGEDEHWIDRLRPLAYDSRTYSEWLDDPESFDYSPGRSNRLAADGAALTLAIARGQEYAGANLRLAFVVACVFFELNGYAFHAPPSEVRSMMNGVWNDLIGLPQLKRWYRRRLEPTGEPPLAPLPWLDDLVDGDLSLRVAGVHAPEISNGDVPGYRFEVHLAERAEPVGAVTLRMGNTTAVERYFGHLDVEIARPFRRQGLATRIVRLLLPLAGEGRLRRLNLVCNPENRAARALCRRLGAELVDIVDAPSWYIDGDWGQRRRCRHVLAVESEVRAP